MQTAILHGMRTPAAQHRCAPVRSGRTSEPLESKLVGQKLAAGKRGSRAGKLKSKAGKQIAGKNGRLESHTVWGFKNIKGWGVCVWRPGAHTPLAL